MTSTLAIRENVLDRLYRLAGDYATDAVIYVEHEHTAIWDLFQRLPLVLQFSAIILLLIILFVSGTRCYRGFSSH
jgi:muconolactone delta-isomerase